MSDTKEIAVITINQNPSKEGNDILSEKDKADILRFHLPRWEELPNLDLYMDQVIAFVDGAIGELFRKIDAPPLTKSMVNNYVKARIIEAPVNKKYSKLAVASAIVVCILKSNFSVEEIGALIRMGMQIGAVPVTYNRFCDAIEEALQEVFRGDISLQNNREKGRENKYLMGNFALSFACKYYTQLSFLSHQKKAAGKKEN